MQNPIIAGRRRRLEHCGNRRRFPVLSLSRRRFVPSPDRSPTPTHRTHCTAAGSATLRAIRVRRRFATRFSDVSLCSSAPSFALYYAPFSSLFSLADHIMNTMNAVLLYVCLAFAAAAGVLSLSVYTDDLASAPKTFSSGIADAFDAPAPLKRSKREDVTPSSSPTTDVYNGIITSKVSC